MFIYTATKPICQLADAKDVIQAIQNVEGARFPVLAPNLKVRPLRRGIHIYKLLDAGVTFLLITLQGFEAAVAAGAKEVAVFASASESFSRSNINCSIEDSLARFREVALAAQKLSIPVRGYAVL